jgi:hypothetical protein
MSIFEIFKHIIGVIFHDHVLHVHVIIVCHLWYFWVRMYCSQSYSLFSLIIEVSFIWSFSIIGLFRDLWYNSTKCLRVRHVLAKWFGPPHLWHVKALSFPFPWPLALFFLFLPLRLSFLNLSNFFFMVDRSINLFITHYTMVNLWQRSRSNRILVMIS